MGYSSGSGVVEDGCGVDLLVEDAVDVLAEVSVVDEVGLASALVLLDQLLDFLLSELKIQSPHACSELYTHSFNISQHSQNSRTYSSFSYGSLSESVEVDEELLDADPVLEHHGLESLLHVQLHIEQLLRPGNAKLVSVLSLVQDL